MFKNNILVNINRRCNVGVKNILHTRRFNVSSKNNQIIVVTGNIGVGKSYVMRHLSKLGFKTIYSDKIANIFMKDAEINNKIKIILNKIFGIELITGLKTMQETISDILSSSLYDNEKKNLLMHKIDSIIHPLVQQEQKKIINDKMKNGCRSIAIESPLFIESKNNLQYNALVLIQANEVVQEKRVLARNNMTFKKFHAINNKQISQNIKKKYVDFILCNNGNRLATIHSINSLINKKKYRYGVSRNCIRYRNHRLRYKKWA